MFPYFGRKKAIAHLYPRPVHDIIVEPFAGSAAYSMHSENWTKQVILVEQSPRFAELWKWLIHEDTDGPALLNALPEMIDIGATVKFDFDDPADTLLSLCMITDTPHRTFLYRHPTRPHT